MNTLKIKPRDPEREVHFDVKADPATKDWRESGYVTEVKNQGLCGSSWAFSATGSTEGQHSKVNGKLVSLSEQNLMDCSYAYGNKGCIGGLVDSAFEYMIGNGGVATEDSYPYTATSSSECNIKNAVIGATIDGYRDILKGSESHLETKVVTIGPISVAIDANHRSFRMYSDGVYYEPSCSTILLNHFMLVIGYGVDSATGLPYWLVKNSFGTSWGEDGYIRMSKDRNNNCGIATLASYPVA